MKNKKEWSVLLHMYKIEFNAVILLGSAFFLTGLPRSGRLSPREG